MNTLRYIGEAIFNNFLLFFIFSFISFFTNVYKKSVLYLAKLIRGRPIIIGVEGLIGAGKTTFLSGLKNHNFTVIEEPVDEWVNLSRSLKGKIEITDNITSDENNIMECYNSNPNKYAYTFQSLVFITKVHNIIKNWNNNNLILVERSPICDKNVFAEMLYSNKLIDNTEWLVYNHWYYKMLDSFNVIPDELIYLKVNVPTAIERVKKRNRKEENKVVDHDYLAKLFDLHEKWLNNNSLIINWQSSDDPANEAKKYSQMIDQLAVDIAIKEILRFIRIID